MTKRPGGRHVANKEEVLAPPIEPARIWFTIVQTIGELSCLDEAIVLEEIATGRIRSEMRKKGEGTQLMVHRDTIDRRLAQVPLPFSGGTGLHAEGRDGVA